MEGDRIHLVKINPRFPAWVYFSTGVDINLPAMLVRLAPASFGTEQERWTKLVCRELINKS